MDAPRNYPDDARRELVDARFFFSFFFYFFPNRPLCVFELISSARGARGDVLDRILSGDVTNWVWPVESNLKPGRIRRGVRQSFHRPAARIYTKATYKFS